MPFMIDFDGCMGARRSCRREYRGVVDCGCDDPRTDATAPQCQPGDSGLIRMCRRPCKDHFVRSCAYGGGNHLSGLVQCLRGKPTRAVESYGITPSGLFCIYPGLTGSREHWLAR
jgi:hypothetical protein